MFNGMKTALSPRAIIRQAILVAALGWSVATLAEGRDATLRVHVMTGKSAPESIVETAATVRAGIERLKPESGLALADADSADFTLLVLFQSAAGRRGQDSTTGSLNYTVRAQILSPKAGVPGASISGTGIVWRDAAEKLVRALELYAESYGGVWLRRRSDWPAVGFEVSALDKDRRRELGIKSGNLWVTDVAPDGPAKTAGLYAGDVVLGIGTRDADGVSDLARAIYTAPAGGRVTLRVAQGKHERTVELVVP
jgi:hypothetical protein